MQQKQSEEEEFTLSQFEDTVHHDGGVAFTVAGHMTSAVRKQTDRCWCSASFLLLLQPWVTDHGMVLCSFKVGLLTSTNLI